VAGEEFAILGVDWDVKEHTFHIQAEHPVLGSDVDDWVLIATCKQLVWSNRIGRNMPI
jgi:hypothetical protein